MFKVLEQQAFVVETKSLLMMVFFSCVAMGTVKFLEPYL